MASANDSTDVPIKYESPYVPDQIPSFSPPSPSLKRNRSEEAEGIEAMGEKRQRTETAPQTIEEDELAVLIAQATASVTQDYAQVLSGQDNKAEVSSYVNYNEQDNGREHGSGFTSDPYLYMRILSLPILESLSTQILSTLAQGPYMETIRIATEPDSELGQAYVTLKSLFDQTKKIYSREAPFISADELNIREPEHRATIRTTNLATFVSSIFGGQDVGFYELNDHFIECFTPDGQPLEREPGQLFLNLKTQMYLSAVSQEEMERTKEETLEDLFPVALDEILAGRHPEALLSQTELEFIEASKERRESLMVEAHDADSIQLLSERYSWEDFLRSLSSHLYQAYEPLIAPYMKRHALPEPPTPVRINDNNLHGQGHSNALMSIEDDISAEAERAAEAALQSLGYGFRLPQQTAGPSHQYQNPQQNGAPYQSQHQGSSIPYPSQTAPTQVLYEQARQAAVAKANPGASRRPGLPSQRRPWSTEEENALMAGLDQVKGPHWSQILALYGANGTISEILKERNQVQLKDKARNLKLFFLKSNIEVPYYLQCVTGELKTRAPTQAARKEAEERARLGGSEDQARFHTIMHLANGIQDHSQSNGHSDIHTAGTPSSKDSDEGPEEFQVVEPEGEDIIKSPSPPRLSEDEQLRQTLLAVNAGSTSHENGAPMANMHSMTT